MKLFVWLGGVTAVSFVAACGALQQAPLIYSSQTVVGADVSSTSAANPGFSVSLGVKQTDVAYVPVAVAASAPQGAASDPIIVRANWGQQDESGANKQIEASRDAKLALYDTAIDMRKAAAKRRDDDQSTLLALQTQLGYVDSALSAIQTLGVTGPQAPVAGSSPAAVDAGIYQQQLAARTTLIQSALIPPLSRIQDDKLKALSAPSAETNLSGLQQSLQGRKSDLAARIASQTQLLAADNAALSDAQNTVSAAKSSLDQVQQLLDTSKSDAMSVYGSFNNTTSGDTTATKPGAALAVGKVFSTGLASQNLTEAARAAAVSSCIVSSIAAAASAAAASVPMSVDLGNTIVAACGKAGGAP